MTLFDSWLSGLCNRYRTFLVFLFSVFIAWEVSAQGTEGSTAEPQTWQEQQREAINTFYKLDQSNNYTESLNYADMNVLPMGIRRTVGNMEVTIAVSDIIWLTTHSELTLFARVKLPQEGVTDKLLFFGAQGIKFSHSGDIIGDASLALMGDVSIPINGNTASLILKGSFSMSTGRAREETYVAVDCQGFSELGISADVEFPESMLSPIDSTGTAIHTDPTGENKKINRVRGSFKTVVTDWNDILVNITLPPFEVKGLKGFIFSVSNASFDFSDLRNDPAVRYPQGYEASYLIPGNPTLWRGVYVKDLTVTLPKEFAKRENKQRVSFEAHDMLLDNNGISGLFGASGILSIHEGSASGWRFSVDKFLLGIEANQLVEANFSGQIGLPVSETTNLAYDALITADDQYVLRVNSLDTVAFDVFHAQAQLHENSYIELKAIDGEFKPEAMLHGSLDFAARMDSDKKVAEVKGIEFRSLRLKTDAPQFTAEYFGYNGEIRMMNFPVSVNKIGIRSTGDEIALALGINVTLSENLFAGSTTLELVGKLNEEKTSEGEIKSQQWKYNKLNISSIAVDAKIAEVFTIKGGLTILNNDPIYGDGYAGDVRLTFDKVLKGLDITTRAMFGYTTFRYWFVDAKVKLPGPGINVGPITLTGFAGGASNRMKPVGAEVLASPSGVTYKPDSLTGFGIKSGVLFNVGSDKTLNGEASFEIGFNKHGGLSYAGFYGFAQFIGTIPGMENIEKFVGDKYKKIGEKTQAFTKDNPALAKTLEQYKQYEPSKVPSLTFEPTVTPGKDGFSAAMGIQYDFNQQSLHATFDLYVNAIGGLVRGTASGNRAGWAVLHIDPSEWYMHLGTPTDRLGIKMGIGNIVNVETGSYLMAGHRIPGSPPPPKQVADILGVDMQELDYMRDLNALGDGRGFAFGSSLKVSTGDITFLILYANFQAGLGFDIMLKDYRDMQCEGRSGKLGFDGWYANGQAYAYLQGELGVKVNLWFLKTKIPIIKGAAAALLQAQLPNPAYFKGYMGVRFSVLGGLVSGNCRFKLTIGDKCELVVPGGSPLDFRMISDLTPEDKSDEVDVFAVPQAAFTMRVDVPFEVEDDQGIKTYRIHLNEFSVYDSDKSISGKVIWTSNKDAASFYSDEVLPPNKTLKALVRVGFEQWNGTKWITVYTSGKKAEEFLDVTFTTGTAPAVIPIQNIQYAYPVLDQQFFLKDETKAAYIQLKRGQSYLFDGNYTYEIQLTGSDGIKQSIPFTYVASENKLQYTLHDLGNKQKYSIDVVSFTKNATQQDAAIAEQKETISEGDNTIQVTTRQANDVVRSDVGKVLLTYNFATSTHNTFKEKVSSIQKGSAIAGRLSSDVINLRYETTGGEPFELTELKGTVFSGNEPLIFAEALLIDKYYQEDIYPVVYKDYPIGGLLLTRDTISLGAPPVKAVPISTAYLTEVENNNYSGIARQRFPYIYNLPMIYKQDFVDVQTKVVNRYMGTAEQSQYNYIISGYYKFIRAGNYKIMLGYRLPDGTPGTTAEFEYYNFIK